jgi:hypothetical protein
VWRETSFASQEAGDSRTWRRSRLSKFSENRFSVMFPRIYHGPEWSNSRFGAIVQCGIM